MVVQEETLRLSPELRLAVEAHLQQLERVLTRKGYGTRVGFGNSPALLVIDLARMFVDRDHPIGADLESVVATTCELLEAARSAGVPVFFTTTGFADDDPMPINSAKVLSARMGGNETELDPRLQRRSTEKLIVKKYASAFKGTDLDEMLRQRGIDTLIVAGCSTSSCVYATCREAASTYRLIVPRAAVGDRTELNHLVYLLDIDMVLGDVMATEDVIEYLTSRAGTGRPTDGVRERE